MGRKSMPRQETSTDRASRQRDNKRQHRARQKEYIASLERRVAEAREQGIQVTKEVQLAAQQITRQNARLKDLLRRTGYTDDFINTWIKEDFSHATELPRLELKSESTKSTRKAKSARGTQKVKQSVGEDQCVQELDLVFLEAPQRGVCPNPCASPTKPSLDIHARFSSPSESSESVAAPCKLITLLAENPAADIRQLQLPAVTDRQSCDANDGSVDGIECSTAYKMLMQYATSDEKVDKIATLLESGCTPCVTGGCKVKNDVLWTALSEECA